MKNICGITLNFYFIIGRKNYEECRIKFSNLRFKNKLNFIF